MCSTSLLPIHFPAYQFHRHQDCPESHVRKVGIYGTGLAQIHIELSQRPRSETKPQGALKHFKSFGEGQSSTRISGISLTSSRPSLQRSLGTRRPEGWSLRVRKAELRS